MSDSWTNDSPQRESSVGPEVRHPRTRAGPTRGSIDRSRMDCGRGASIRVIARWCRPNHVPTATSLATHGVYRFLDLSHQRERSRDEFVSMLGSDREARGRGVRDRAEIPTAGHGITDPPGGRVASRRHRNEGTFWMLTDVALPDLTRTRASTRSAVVSSRTTVCGSVTSTMPVSTSASPRRSCRDRASANNRCRR
jgi:hypothetical protein